MRKAAKKDGTSFWKMGAPILIFMITLLFWVILAKWFIKLIWRTERSFKHSLRAVKLLVESKFTKTIFIRLFGEIRIPLFTWLKRPYKQHSPTAMVGLWFALLLLRKEQDRIHMPRWLMDNLEGVEKFLRLQYSSVRLFFLEVKNAKNEKTSIFFSKNYWQTEKNVI